MYLRWVVAEIDGDSHRRLGVFHAAAGLRERGELHPKDRAYLEELRDWFNDRLEKPEKFTASKPPYYRKQSKAISWFKDTAHEHIAKAREMAGVVEHYGIPVTVLKSERVGYVVSGLDTSYMRMNFRSWRSRSRIRFVDSSIFDSPLGGSAVYVPSIGRRADGWAPERLGRYGETGKRRRARP